MLRLTQWSRKRPAAGLVVGCMLLITSSPVWSFGTINHIGQMAEHERITRAALACPAGGPVITLPGSNGDCFEPLSLTQLAGDSGFFGAVGSPDFPIPPEPPAAHCDDADFFMSSNYPQTRSDATSALEDCVAHLQKKFVSGLKFAEGLVDQKNRITPADVDFTIQNCNFTASIPFRSKCNVIEGFGRALHGVQDFYSHSNWVDVVPGPYTVNNPPGLGNLPLAPILDLRRMAFFAPTLWSVPDNLSTGCYGGIKQDETPGVGDCKGRVTHNTLNKDTGVIDPVTGGTSSPTTPRGQIVTDGVTNFARAVGGAIVETRFQWEVFRSELREMYGSLRGNLMICAMTRDSPINDCQGRKIALVVDSSGSNTETDPNNLRITAAQSFAQSLVTFADAVGQPPDQVMVIDFDSSARVVYPLGDPAGVNFDGIDSFGGTFIAGGISLALDELTKDPKDKITNNHAGIIVFTDGQDENQGPLEDQLARAKILGIRVAFGFLSPTGLTPQPTISQRSINDVPVDLLTAILKTGGFFSTIDSAAAQRDFVEQVFARGVTSINDGMPSVSGGPLFPGITLSGLISPSKSGIFTYSASVGDQLTFTVRSSSNQLLNSTLRDVRAAVVLANAVMGSATITYNVTGTRGVELELLVKTLGQIEGVYSVGLNVTAPCNCAGNTNHDVVVGGAGPVFTPNQITARPGDTITFSFRAKNHSVTQSTLENPCQKLIQSNGQHGFDSGFVVVPSTVNSNFPTYKITVNDTKPIWGFCRQGPPISKAHCPAGMVFAVNAPPNTFSEFLNKAKQQHEPICSVSTSVIEVATIVTSITFCNTPSPTTTASSQPPFTPTCVVIPTTVTTTYVTQTTVCSSPTVTSPPSTPLSIPSSTPSLYTSPFTSSPISVPSSSFLSSSVSICVPPSVLTPGFSVPTATVHHGAVAGGFNSTNHVLDQAEEQKSVFHPSNKYFSMFVALVCIIAVQATVILGAVVWCCRNRKKADGRTENDTVFMSKYSYLKPGERTAPVGLSGAVSEYEDDAKSSSPQIQ